ncbi:hypothetical protein P171DRAFT_440222 [Karstenula rhodostoma CBS 690.94]|uniref:Uncharacterized protein n=1 Tax=Karstenula rhodostoma CBS 690.94 TaxID=1392251 RepID=A0A9P4PST8_9PLEO|nr:hypothetical protein P171DRAFT_440222 [Karstenula rhodostoma CBS 690.94]
MAAPTPIMIPRLSNEATLSVLPGATIRGLTGCSIGLFGNAISNHISEFVEDADNVEGQSNASTCGSNIFFRMSAAVFMSRGRVDQTLVSEYVLPTLANGRNHQNIDLKGSIGNLNARLKSQIFGNQQLYSYIMSCFDDYVLRAALDDLPTIDTLTSEQAGTELIPYYDEKVFLTMWYKLCQAVHLKELVENRIQPVDHPANTIHVASQMWLLSCVIFSIMGRNIFIALDLGNNPYPGEGDQLPPMPTAKIYADVKEIYASDILFPRIYQSHNSQKNVGGSGTPWA